MSMLKVVTGDDENVMKIASYEDGDWILNYFDDRASAVQKLKSVVFHQWPLQRKARLGKMSNRRTTSPWRASVLH